MSYVIRTGYVARNAANGANYVQPVEEEQHEEFWKAQASLDRKTANAVIGWFMGRSQDLWLGGIIDSGSLELLDCAVVIEGTRQYELEIACRGRFISFWAPS